MSSMGGVARTTTSVNAAALVVAARIGRAPARRRSGRTLLQRAEAEFGEQLIAGARIRGAQLALVPAHGDRQIALGDGHVAARARLRRMLGEQAGDARGRHFVHSREQRIERAVRGDELHRGLLADAGDAGEIIRRVSLEPAIVRQLRRRQAVALAHRGDVVARQVGDAAAGQHHRDAVVDELQQIVVARHHDRLHALARRLRCERGDAIVGLFALDLDDGDAPRLQHLAHDGELRFEIVRRRRPVRFVLRRRGEPLGWDACVETCDHVGRPLVADDAVEHALEAVHRIGRPSVLRRERRQREEGAIDQRVGVDEQQPSRCVVSG